MRIVIPQGFERVFEGLVEKKDRIALMSTGGFTPAKTLRFGDILKGA